MKNKGLGKGLASIFSDAEEDYGRNILFNEDKKQTVSEVDIGSVFANPNQPRKVFDETALNELADSIKKHGVIMPIIVNDEGNGKYMIIAGERRWRASRIAGLKKIPVIIKNYTERQIKEISLIENLQREDLNPIESATAMRSLMDDYGLTQEELADRIGKSRPAIANTLRLLSLTPDVVSLVANNKLSAGHARALITLPESEQIKFAKEAVKTGMSVRDVEEKVKDYFTPPEEKKKKPHVEQSADLKEFISRMQRVLGTKVNAIGNETKGRIYIDYYIKEDLDRIADIIDFVEKNMK
ncbi:MAG TPA: chromosome partitioning protein ParB [Clostridiales bacterium]|nr:chromosome partitioning protein ParB [Clostridiales bacterium]